MKKLIVLVGLLSVLTTGCVIDSDWVVHVAGDVRDPMGNPVKNISADFCYTLIDRSTDAEEKFEECKPVQIDEFGYFDATVKGEATDGTAMTDSPPPRLVVGTSSFDGEMIGEPSYSSDSGCTDTYCYTEIYTRFLFKDVVVPQGN